MYKRGNPEIPRMLFLAQTGVAAININDTSIHTSLGINIEGKMYPVSNEQRTTLQNNLPGMVE